MNEKIVQILRRDHLSTNGWGRGTVEGGLFALTESGKLFFMADNADDWVEMPLIKATGTADA